MQLNRQLFMSMRIRVFTLGALLHLAVISRAQQFNLLAPRVKQLIDSTYNSLISKYKVAGLSLAIVDNNQVVYSAGYGFADRERKIKADDYTIYRINSSTKPFTALAILQLRQQGKLEITDPVTRHLPELRIGNRYSEQGNATLRDMMSHVSGFPTDIWNGTHCDAPPDMSWVIRQLNLQTTILPVRYMHVYSNVAFGLLGEVIARASGMSYGKYLAEHVFRPLEMRSSFIVPEERFQHFISKSYFGRREIVEPGIRDAGAGGIYSNVLDMSQFMLMLLNKGQLADRTILPRAAINEMTSDQLTGIPLKENARSYGYGTGIEKAWLRSAHDSSMITLIGHDGGGVCFRSVFRVIPELNVGVVVLTNTDNGQFIWFENHVLEIYLRETKGRTIHYCNLPADKAAAMQQPATMDAIKGHYNLGSAVVTVRNTRKIRVRYGAGGMVLRQKQKNKAEYSAKLVALGFIPIGKSEFEYSFVTMKDEVFVKSLSKRNGSERFIAARTAPQPVPQSWKNKRGSYVLAAPPFKCTGCPVLVMDNMKMKISVEKDHVVIRTHNPTGDFNEKFFLETVSDSVAVTGGIGRGTSETVRILPNGNIYYTGFEFSRKK